LSFGQDGRRLHPLDAVSAGCHEGDIHLAIAQSDTDQPSCANDKRTRGPKYWLADFSTLTTGELVRGEVLVCRNSGPRKTNVHL
jgi:hypothetical protein